ncbi:MAG: acetyl-CoA carboxylase carboxyltransferase subunit alpha [Candidatus Poribacteria bacterium]|nr:acetyl-CoA carboxylase carboxyltransferase subunit alpha [Candidatus Poribacteria bacterium]
MKSNDIHFEESMFAVEERLKELRAAIEDAPINLQKDAQLLEKAYEQERNRFYERLSPWQKVWLARRSERPRGSDYVQALIEDPVPICADRIDGDDPALLTGVGWFDETPVVYFAQQKGRNTKENIRTSFGMMHPQGYRKARRLMRFAAKFNRPILSFVDTPAAHPCAHAEKRGQANAIAENLFEMSQLPAPFIAVVVGEGGSGGALGVAMGNAALMLEHAVYCVAPPEACSGILWKDSGEHAPEAAEGLKLTANDLKKWKVIDEIIPEPPGGAHRDPQETYRRVQNAVKARLQELSALTPDQLIEQRRRRFRQIGVFQEGGEPPD